MSLFNPIVTLFNAGIDEARLDKTSNLNNLEINSRLNDEGIKRLYLDFWSKLLNDPALMICSFCDHGLVDEPKNNDISHDHNMKVMGKTMKQKSNFNSVRRMGNLMSMIKAKPLQRLCHGQKKMKSLSLCTCSVTVTKLKQQVHEDKAHAINVRRWE
jgi:hypothetical protein